jgi:hypothetical protein
MLRERVKKEKGRVPCGLLPFNAVRTAVLRVLDCVLQPTYSEAAEAAAAAAAFLCDFLCVDFFVVFVTFFADVAAAGADADASGAEACANAAVAKRPATRAAISLFIL